MTKKVIAFGGYHATGGSVIRDILKEYQEIFVFPTEFRILIEHKGLLDLENTIFNNGGCENIDLAIKDFLWLCSNLARKTTKFTRKGFDFDHYTNNKFSESIRLFIDQISDYKYMMNWHYYDFQKSYIRSQIERYAARLFGNSLFEKEAYMCNIDYEQFQKCAKNLLINILDNSISASKSKNRIFALHNVLNPLSINSIEKVKKYFDDFLIIIVDRDPRDVFMDFPENRYLPKGKSTLEQAKLFTKFYLNNNFACSKVLLQAKLFTKFYLNLRKNQKIIASRNDVLLLKFEDMIYLYDSQIKKINNFIGSSKRSLSLNKKFFDPNKSKKNIGKFNDIHPDKYVAIKYIEDNLSEYLYVKF